MISRYHIGDDSWHAVGLSGRGSAKGGIMQKTKVDKNDVQKVDVQESGMHKVDVQNVDVQNVDAQQVDMQELDVKKLGAQHKNNAVRNSTRHDNYGK